MSDLPQAQDLFQRVPTRFTPLFDQVDLPWEPLARLSGFLADDLQTRNDAVARGSVTIEGDVEIGPGTVIEPGVVIQGPTIIGARCMLRPGAYVREQSVIGDGCVIGHATEVVRSIVMAGVRLDHFNYVGDSILGVEVQFGAGAKTANVRFDGRSVVIEGVDTGMSKLGVILGDRCRVGVNVALGPGVIFARKTRYAGAHLLPSGCYDADAIRMLVSDGCR